jgi:hypothetical protein
VIVLKRSREISGPSCQPSVKKMEDLIDAMKAVYSGRSKL